VGDKHFTIVAIIGVIVLGALGLVGGTVLIVCLKDAIAGAACIGLASTSIGVLGGVLIAPKLQPYVPNEPAS
jgi:hypothetical protein